MLNTLKVRIAFVLACVIMIFVSFCSIPLFILAYLCGESDMYDLLWDGIHREVSFRVNNLGDD